MNSVVNQVLRRMGLLALGATLIAGASACAAAAVGAGAAGAVYLTDNGAEARVEASVDETYAAAREAAQEMNITVTETTKTSQPGAAMPADTAKADSVKRDADMKDNGATKRELEGKAGDRDVNITIEQDGTLTKIEVTAKTSPVTWDKDYARSLLEEILEKTRD